MIKVPVEEAVGLPLGHDITKIVPGKEKYRAFRRGQIITAEDIPRLKDIGKNHIFVEEEHDTMVHEDEAARRIAQKAAGHGVVWTEPNQGRVDLRAAHDGLFKVQVDQLVQVNNLPDVIMSTLHTDRLVAKDQLLAGTRIVPLAIDREILDQAEKRCLHPMPLLEVKPFKPLWVGVITTGSEVNSGRIKDGFSHLIRQKIGAFGGRWMGRVIVPDEAELIAREINNFIAEGVKLLIVTGGMSVDADDVTPQAIKQSGAETVFYGAPILPGSQFMLAYQGNVAICGVPGGALYNKRTTLDLVLPRIFAEERISRAEIVALGHGGLCEGCRTCRFPHCAFGK